LSITAALVFAGCAPAPLTPGGAAVELVRAPRPGCALVGSLRGSAGYNGRSGETNAADVEIYLRNQSAERGGDTMVITSRRAGAAGEGDSLSQPRGASASGGCPNCIAITAEAYRCGAGAAKVAPLANTPVTAHEPDPPFSEKASQAALSAAAESAKTCRKPEDRSGAARVKVTFATTGDVVYAEVEGEPFATTPIGECVARKFRNARVPPFAGEPRSTTIAVRLE
jgi:hypothetical protein